jgi:hypothetical protein
MTNTETPELTTITDTRLCESCWQTVTHEHQTMWVGDLPINTVSECSNCGWVS